jgi:hypothetical protein
VGLSADYLGILTTVVMVRAISMTPEATLEDVVGALKNLSLMPSDRFGSKSKICRRVERLRQIIRERRGHVALPPPVEREGLTFNERRHTIMCGPKQLRDDLKREAECQTAKSSARLTNYLEEDAESSAIYRRPGSGRSHTFTTTKRASLAARRTLPEAEGNPS